MRGQVSKTLLWTTGVPWDRAELSHSQGRYSGGPEFVTFLVVAGPHLVQDHGRATRKCIHPLGGYEMVNLHKD